MAETGDGSVVMSHAGQSTAHAFETATPADAELVSVSSTDTPVPVNHPETGKRVAVIGGGLMGLVLADRLAASGARVTVYEGAEQLGGLTTHHDFGRFVWDKFYHVILPSDIHLINLIRDVGLGDKLRWQATRTGYYTDNKFHSLSTNAEFLKFPPLSLLDKLRLAVTIVYGSRINNWKRMETISSVDWLKRVSGQATYRKFWKPLLLAKLGENYRRVSAVFIWSYIKRLFSARDPSVGKEQLGHVEGGYRTVFDALGKRISERGEIRLGTRVEAIRPLHDGRLEVVVDDSPQIFDRVVFTGPTGALRRVADRQLVEVAGPGKSVEYLGVICLVMVTRKPLTPYYVLNLADESLPFTGVIGMSNVVDNAETDGLHLTYFPRYLLSGDKMMRKTDAEIIDEFLPAAKRLYPELRDEDIESMHINRAPVVQPLQVVDYSNIVPGVKTRHPSFFVLNTSQFVNGTLNNNEVVRSVDEFMTTHRRVMVPRS
jgi:protoporphyrinogen oxidase